MTLPRCVLLAKMISCLSSQSPSEPEECPFHVYGDSKFDLKRGSNEIVDVCIVKLDGKIRCPKHCRQELDTNGAAVPPCCLEIATILNQSLPYTVGSLVPSTDHEVLSKSNPTLRDIAHSAQLNKERQY